MVTLRGVGCVVVGIRAVLETDIGHFFIRVQFAMIWEFPTLRPNIQTDAENYNRPPPPVSVGNSTQDSKRSIRHYIRDASEAAHVSEYSAVPKGEDQVPAKYGKYRPSTNTQ